jgi:hypothetical protein
MHKDLNTGRHDNYAMHLGQVPGTPCIEAELICKFS